MSKILKNNDRISVEELKEMSKKMFGNMVKAVVDIEKEIMAIDGELHSDLEQILIEQENSEPRNCWGFNFYPEKTGADFIEFDSMINLKPAFNNRSRGVEDPKVREKIIEIVKKYAA